MPRRKAKDEIGGDQVMLTCRVLKDQQARLAQMAKRRNRFVADEIREAIDGHIARDNYGEADKRGRKR